MTGENSHAENDILKRVRSENAALRELIKRSSLGYQSIDINGMLLDVNQVWLDTMGYSSEEVVGKWFGNFIHETYLEKFKKGFAHLREKGIIEDFTFILKHKAGHAIELVFNGTIERAPDGTFLRSHSAFRRSEADIIKDENRVYLGIEERIFNKTRLELMGEMLGAIAHQWRQPLNALALIVQDTQEAAEISGLQSDEIKSNTAMAMELIMKMSSTIDSFRSFFSDRHEEDLISVTSVLTECISLVFSQLQQCGIDFTFICESSNDYFICTNEVKLPPCQSQENLIKCSGIEMKHIFLNIISNARYAIVKAIMSGHRSRGKIEFHVRFSAECVVITVTNNGENIPEKALSRIFEPYFTTKDEGEGIGLGLFISKTVIEKYMRGTIDIFNCEGGVTVRIVLPLAACTGSTSKTHLKTL
ncbi:PAS domain-containing sensor histidine kinase [Seleniivibrio sp.]|uniref:PAS domain-containing sensor histidine kinase n=1 Tax=Seleniivibrio sp. TaxID=2898801 RepID=UPI0025F7248A|nr:PAS domain-containing sensor histidine kinase [Seleniivibrio sp.]MCD8553632.1 PAS domain-containing sensor histidine kinase [Seleniivibrio sp.]